MATTKKIVTSTKWAPNLGIPGNSKGVFTFTCVAPVTVYNSENGSNTLYQAGTHSISVNRTPAAGKSITQAFVFSYNGKIIRSHHIKLQSSPLIYCRWKPTNSFDARSLIKSGEGTLDLKWVGVSSIAIPQLGIPATVLPPNNSFSMPANLPPDVTKIVRGDLKIYAELFLRANLVADGQTKIVTIKIIFG